MKNQKCDTNAQDIKEALLKEYEEHLEEIFSEGNKDLTFTELETLVDKKLKKETCAILEKHIAQAKWSSSSDEDRVPESVLCHCGREANIVRNKEGGFDYKERDVLTKNGYVKIKEHHYYCESDRKFFFR